jgi:hypothetical protein
LSRNGQVGLSKSIWPPSMILPTERQARSRRSSSHRPIRQPSGPVPCAMLRSLPMPTTTARATATAGPTRCAVRVHPGGHRPEPAAPWQTDRSSTAARDGRVPSVRSRLCCGCVPRLCNTISAAAPNGVGGRTGTRQFNSATSGKAIARHTDDFCNKIGQERTPASERVGTRKKGAFPASL